MKRPNWKSEQGCSKLRCEWWCRRCQSLIYYDLDSKFFCECGDFEAFEYEFMCNDNHHPENKFSKYEKCEIKENILLEISYSEYFRMYVVPLISGKKEIKASKTFFKMLFLRH